jgi:hypothetical protein
MLLGPLQAVQSWVTGRSRTSKRSDEWKRTNGHCDEVICYRHRDALDLPFPYGIASLIPDIFHGIDAAEQVS